MSEKKLQEWLKKNELKLNEEQQHSTHRADENIELICKNHINLHKNHKINSRGK